MAYEKRLCVLKQIRKGFSADGSALSGAIHAERIGETLTLTLRIIGLAPVREGRYALAVKIKKQAYVFDIAGNETLKIENCPTLSDGFCALLCFLRGEAEGLAFGKCGNAQAGVEELLALFSQPQERGRKKCAESACAEEQKRKGGLPYPLPPTQVPGIPNPQVPLAPTPPTEEGDGGEPHPTGNYGGRKNTPRGQEEALAYSGREHFTHFTAGEEIVLSHQATGGSRENIAHPTGYFYSEQKSTAPTDGGINGGVSHSFTAGESDEEHPTRTADGSDIVRPQYSTAEEYYRGETPVSYRAGENTAHSTGSVYDEQNPTHTPDGGINGGGAVHPYRATGEQGRKFPTYSTDGGIHGGHAVQQAEYCDEAIARENYFLREGRECGASDEDGAATSRRQRKGEKKENLGTACEDEEGGAIPTEPISGSLTYYYEVKEKLDNAFRKYPKDFRLCATFPHSEWVNTGNGLLGVVYRGGIPSLLCLAFPKGGELPKNEEDFIFVPDSPFCDDEGFYVIFQSADSGEIVRIAEG